MPVERDSSAATPADEAHWDERGLAAGESEADAVCYPGAPAFLNGYANWSQRRAVSALLARVGELGGKSALDVGCGTGRWTELLAARGADAVGVDRSETMLAEARRRRPGLDFRRMGATELAFPDDSFDLATVVTVVQHLQAADQALAAAEIARVVKPGGYVLAVDRVGRSSDFSAGHGTHPRTRDSWRALWRTAGADLVVRRGQEFSYPLAAAALGRSSATPAAGPRTHRRGGRGWRRSVLAALVGASYATEVVASLVPGAPATHVAALYVVR